MVALLNNKFFLFAIAVVISSLGGFGLLIFGLFRILRSSNIVNQRMQIFAGNRGKTSPINKNIYRVMPRQLSGSFFNRAIKPFFQKLIIYFGKFTPANSIAKSDFDLRAAGNPFGMHAREFYGFRMIFLFLGVGLTFLIYLLDGFSSLGSVILGMFVIILALFIPKLWLGQKIRQRRDELSHNLPDVLDMLSICATAGLSFDQGLKKICEIWPTALIEEFKQVLQEMDMGLTRAEALRNLKNRVKVDDLSSFIAIIIQSENTGMSYAEMLQSQARQMRIMRQFRAKEKANALPGKMIIPVVIFIFPALVAILLGPLLPTLLNLFP